MRPFFEDASIKVPRHRASKQKHRPKIGGTADWPLFSACVARSVTKTELKTNKPARDAMALEWKKLSDRGCWDLKGVKPKREVADRAKKDKDLKVHFGRIFGICVEKGSELPEGD